jgi:hypothetical protein
MLLPMNSHDVNKPRATNYQQPAVAFSPGAFFPQPPLNVATSSATSGSSSLPYVSPASASSTQYMSVTSCHESLSLSVASDHSKRGRDDSESESYSLPDILGPVSLSKKTRENAYIAPRKVPQTFTSTVGTLATCSASDRGRGGGIDRRVHFRRQLSVSKVESFLDGDHNAMDVDTSETRPRSMSF